MPLSRRRVPLRAPDASDRHTHAASGDAGPANDPQSGHPIENLRALARDLAEVPEAIRAAPDRAVRRSRGGMPAGAPGRLRRWCRAAAWPVIVLLASGAAALALSFAGR